MTSYTVTANNSDGSPGIYLQVEVITNATETGGASAGLSDAGTPGSTTLTPNFSGSFIAWACDNANPGLSAITPATNNKLLTVGANADSFDDSGGGNTQGAGYYSGTVTGGTGVTVGYSNANGSSNAELAAYEVPKSGGAWAEDASTPAWANTQSTHTITSASFTPPPGAVLVAVVSCNYSGTGTASTTLTVSSTPSLTWTARKFSGTSPANGGAAIFTATVPGVTPVPRDTPRYPQRTIIPMYSTPRRRQTADVPLITKNAFIYEPPRYPQNFTKAGQLRRIREAPTIPTLVPPFSPVGSAFQTDATPWTFAPPSGSAAGDLVCVEILTDASGGTGNYATALSSSNCTWTLAAHYVGTTNSLQVSLFLGKLTSTSSASVSVTWSVGTPTYVRGDGQVFSSTVGSWALDTWTYLDSIGTSTWPTLTAAGSGELYFGYAFNSGSAIAGSTSGFTSPNGAYFTDTHSNGMAYSVTYGTSSTGPVWGDSTETFGIMALIKATSGPQSAPAEAANLVRSRPPSLIVPIAKLLRRASGTMSSPLWSYTYWTPQGSFLQNSGAGVTSVTLSLNNQLANDFIFLVTAASASSASQAIGVSGGGVNWVQATPVYYDSVNNYSFAIFVGQVVATGAQTATVAYRVSCNPRLAGQEFTSALGSWLLDSFVEKAATDTSAWPSLTPVSGGELYLGFARNDATATPGSTPGFTYDVPAIANGFAFNPDCPFASAAPVWGDSTQTSGIMALFISVPPQPVPHASYRPIHQAKPPLRRRGNVAPIGLSVPVKLSTTSEWTRPRFTRVLLFRRGNVSPTGWPVPVQPPELPHSVRRGSRPLWPKRGNIPLTGVGSPPFVGPLPEYAVRRFSRPPWPRRGNARPNTGLPVPVQPPERMQSVRRWSRPLWPRRGVTRNVVPPQVPFNPPISFSERRWSRPPWPRRGVVPPTGWPVSVQPPERMQAVRRWTRPLLFRKGVTENVVPPPIIPLTPFVPVTQRETRRLIKRFGRTVQAPGVIPGQIPSVTRPARYSKIRRTSREAPGPLYQTQPPYSPGSARRFERFTAYRRGRALLSGLPLPVQPPELPDAIRRPQRYQWFRKGSAQPNTGLPISVQPPERMQFVRRWIKPLWPRRGVVPSNSYPLVIPVEVKLPVWVWITIRIPSAQITQSLPNVSIIVIIPLESEEEV